MNERWVPTAAVAAASIGLLVVLVLAVQGNQGMAVSTPLGVITALVGVSHDRIERMERAALAVGESEHPPSMVQILYLALLALTTTAISVWLAGRLPELALGGQVVVSESTWVILLVTTNALGLSTTRARDLPGAQPIATAIIYVFVASIGARANNDGVH